MTDFLTAEHGAVHLVAGHDFRFGYRGEGNPERLRGLCRELGLGCDIIPRVEREHITVSSTYIRTLVTEGEMARVRAFLGHPHTLGMTCAGAGDGVLALAFAPGILRPAPGHYDCRIGRWGTGEEVPAPAEVTPAGAILCRPAEPLPARPGDKLILAFYDRLPEKGVEITAPGAAEEEQTAAYLKVFPE